MASKRPGNRGQKRAHKVANRQRRRSATSDATDRQIASLLGRFDEWLRDQGPSVPTAPTTRVVRSILGGLDQALDDFDPTGWTPDAAHVVLDSAEGILERDDSDSSAAAADHLVASASDYLDFLIDTDAWTGSDEDLEHCLGDFDDFLGGDVELLTPDDIDLPTVAPAAIAKAIDDLPLAAALDRLIAWAQGSPAVNAREVATALGVDVPASRFQGPGDVPELADMWTAAQDARLVQATPDGAVTLPDASAFRDRDPDVTARALASFVAARLTPVDGADAVTTVARHFAAQTVLAAMTPEPPVRNDEEDYSDLEDDDREVAEAIRDVVGRFVDDAILVGGQTLAVVPELRAAVHAGVVTSGLFTDEEP
ncbi:hypothetical protein [Rhodococcus sp. HNM0569]|uniref:hypothetical protein n=1 Tax=Rhodococcus sp. HNM0569 TaxID=2716340 RepID=UPI00146DD05B|nr:hypothetical protein [Rhodococcus sp. HNM0569]NLU81355.1 hypothetical protein [Rhodococcus sp. HNM0569]